MTLETMFQLTTTKLRTRKTGRRTGGMIVMMTEIKVGIEIARETEMIIVGIVTGTVEIDGTGETDETEISVKGTGTTGRGSHILRNQLRK